MSRKPVDVVQARLRELAGADTVAFGGVGFVGELLPVTEAYRELAAAVARDGEALRPQLEWLVEHGSPAGKVYGVTLLRELDPAAAREAWRRLAGDRSEVTTFSGCVMNKSTLAEYAASQL
ncbi:MAG TPA: hypothetical protein VFB84_21285 [Micromonosporaceae bacterium]|nr:hypothetical protein [Micromonosporaceae bacterium]